MSQIDIAVVIPTHNRRDMVLRTVQMLAGQTHPANRFEVIVICDGCVDGSYEALNAIATPFRLRVFAQPQSGVAAARNNGAAQAEVPVILFIDDDIIATRDLVAEHLRVHDGRPDRVVIGRLLPDPDVDLPGWIQWEQRTWDDRYAALERVQTPVTGLNFFSGNVSVDRLLFVRIGGFNERYRRAEDTELGYRLQKAGAEFFFNGKAGAIHCGIHPFEPWTKTHYNYGRYHVRLAQDEGYGDFMPLAVWFRERNLLNRILVRSAVGWLALHRISLVVARTAAFAADRLGLQNLSRWSYSAIVNLSYWQGVADELGGARQLWSLVRPKHRAQMGGADAS